MKQEVPWQDELRDLLEVEEGLTDWEVNFIESMENHRRRGEDASERQKFKVGQLWDKHCG